MRITRRGAALAPFVSRVIAVDASAAMLQAGKKRLSAFDNVDLRHQVFTAQVNFGTFDVQNDATMARDDGNSVDFLGVDFERHTYLRSCQAKRGEA